MKPTHSHGFSIVEAMVSVFILMTALSVGLSLFSFTSKNTRQVEQRQARKDAIDAAIAQVREINDRYSCTETAASSPPTLTCGLSPADPDENSYMPSMTLSDLDENDLVPGSNPFANKCANGFASSIIALINTLDQIPGVSRTSTVNANNNNLYKVEWSAEQRVIRSIELYPTVAAWCP